MKIKNFKGETIYEFRYKFGHKLCNELIDKFAANQEFKANELIRFFYFDEVSRWYIGCDNSTGDVWVEQFWTKEDAIIWLS